MKAPTATYRVQFNKAFTFSDLKSILAYLRQLGISHIYASPIFQAKKGSMHGYDVTDPNAISEELGGRAGFEELARDVAAYGLGWLQDIVPNHASYSFENKWLYDVWMKGAGSAYACFFDIDWNHPSEKLYGKPMVPFLAQPYKQCLKQRQIVLIHNDSFKIKYETLEFPVNAATAQHLELDSLVLQNLEKINENLEFLNALIARQYYRLAYWKTALRHINYRRFFDINGLIGVRMENSVVFDEWHRLVFRLVQAGVFSGLRVDHIDGLYEPEVYLNKLRAYCPNAYLIVEKILVDKEQLPNSWPVEGTTGYDFLNYTNKLFFQGSAEPETTAFYREFTGDRQDFRDLLYDAKKTIIKTHFLGDVHNLARLFSETLGKLAYAKPFGRRNMVSAVVELLACFPVYRTYLCNQHWDDASFKLALILAEQQSSEFADEFSAIAYMLKEGKNSPHSLAALMRFQQFTSAIMAKGFEDTALYRYPRMLSLNEVGSNPTQFGITAEEFHSFNLIRQQNWSLSLNTTSTHDTKRGEDVRARLNALKEVANEFKVIVKQWASLNAAKKGQLQGKPVPDGAEEYYLYQTLLGAYPWNLAQTGFVERINQHMTKALREAKVHTSWIEPNLLYEEAVRAFATETLADDSFIDTFLPFQKKIAFYGFYNSLAQTLLKITCPGVPDFYQGTELWDLNLADPDNRRPVNFQKRQELLAEVAKLRPEGANELLLNPGDGKAKIYLIYKALELRRKQRLLFEEGVYLPLAVKGSLAEHVVAFCRKKSCVYALVVVPRFLTSLLSFENGRVAGQELNVDWADTYISLPEGAPARWNKVFTDRILLSCCGRLPLRDVLDRFPVALLWGDSNV